MTKDAWQPQEATGKPELPAHGTLEQKEESGVNGRGR